MLGIGVMTLSLLAPVTEVSAANKNKVAEIPVIFKNMSGEELEKCDWNDSKTDFTLWSLGDQSAYSESYRVSYKSPASIIEYSSNILRAEWVPYFLIGKIPVIYASAT